MDKRMITPAPISTLRFVLRISSAFTLDLLKIYSRDRDFTDVVILAALMQSKAARLARSPDLQWRYGGFDAPVPKDLRRAISINALALSLELPFETVRRRTRRLIKEGLCEVVDDGVRVSDRLLTAEAQRDALHKIHAIVRELHLRLLRADCVQPMKLPPSVVSTPVGDEAPIRIVGRFATDYFLRSLEVLLPHFSNLTQAFVVLELVSANTAAFSDALRGDEQLDAAGFVPDSFRRPVRASEVAKRLQLPHETTRRHLATLIEEGRCERVPGGFIVPAAVLAGPNVIAAFAANFQNLRRMFADLAETGVLALWGAEPQLERTRLSRKTGPDSGGVTSVADTGPLRGDRKQGCARI